MAKENAKVSDIEVAKSVIAHEAVRCFLAQETKGGKPSKPTSCFGGIFWGKAGETWPTSADGAPLLPWLQILCADVKQAYGPFYRPQLIAFYVDPEFFGGEASSKPDKSEFVVRTYQQEDRLKPLERPKELKEHKYVGITWKETLDYPSLSKYYRLFESSVYSALCELKKFNYENKPGTKIGGWTTPVQTDQEYPDAWDLQIDGTPNYSYADSGIAYLSNRGEKWYTRFETC